MNKRKRAKRRASRREPGYYLLYSENIPMAPELVAFRVGAVPAGHTGGAPVVVGINLEQAKMMGFTAGLIQKEVAEAWKRKACSAADKAEASKAGLLADLRGKITETVKEGQRISHRNGAVPWMVQDRHGKPPAEWRGYCTGRDDAYRHCLERVEGAFDAIMGVTRTPKPPPPVDDDYGF